MRISGIVENVNLTANNGNELDYCLVWNPDAMVYNPFSDNVVGYFLLVGQSVVAVVDKNIRIN